MEKVTQTKNRLKKVAIVGPESTGKTYLAEALANHFDTVWVPEYARDYLNEINRPYTKDDLEIIALEQLNMEEKLSKRAKKILICDTTLLVIKIWSEYKYGHCEEWIINEVNSRYYNLHILTYIDAPWEDDPQREHPHKREFFYDLYYRELQRLGVDFIEVKGSSLERYDQSVSAVYALL